MKRIFALILMLLLVMSVTSAQDGGSLRLPIPEDRPVGLTINTGAVQDGYILLPIIQSSSTWLLSNDGRIVHTWPGEYNSASSAYLKENGNLVRIVSKPDPLYGPTGPWTYMNGRIEELNWDGEVVWSYEYGDDRVYGHHDIEIMPNGHILMLAYDRHFEDEALAAGRKPELMPEDREVWAEQIMELDPETNEIVWEWKVWDHLVQDFDPNLDNYGVVSENLGKIDINYNDVPPISDWLHMNTVEYNAERDEIILSPKDFNEVWVIDHSISTEEAAGEAGDLLYRWGNPEAYGLGTDEDQQIIGQHHPQWITQDLPGAGDIILFDNGKQGEREYSRAVEITPPFDAEGNYIMNPGEVTDPAEPTWVYVADPPEAFYSSVVSGAQRQPNGNTLVAVGVPGILFEVSPEGEVVWEYYLPPAARPFRGDRYDLSALGDFDQGQDLSDELGFDVEWLAQCVDGDVLRLHPYLANEKVIMDLFIATHGENAEAQWLEEACAEYGGLVEDEG